MTTLSEKPQPTIHLTAVCHDCKRRHEIRATPWTFASECSQWEAKHRGHRFEIVSPKREIPAGLDTKPFDDANRGPWWLEEYAPNVDLKLSYATSAALTITLASLTSSATLVAGRESTVVDNTTNLFLDYMISGKVTTGTTPTVDKQILVMAYGALDDTPNFPDVLDGTDSAETLTSADIRNAALETVFGVTTDATSNRTYFFGSRSLATAFAGLVPLKWGLWVTHDTAVNLNATGSNHAFTQTGIFVTG